MQAQYVFIHDALSELIICGDTEIGAANLRIAINRLCKPDKDKVTKFQRQFQVSNGYHCDHCEVSFQN